MDIGNSHSYPVIALTVVYLPDIRDIVQWFIDPERRSRMILDVIPELTA